MKINLDKLLYCGCGNLIESDSTNGDLCISCGYENESEYQNYLSYYDYLNVSDDENDYINYLNKYSKDNKEVVN